MGHSPDCNCLGFYKCIERDYLPMKEAEKYALIVGNLGKLWLDMLDDGIGGLPTKKEAEIFEKITNILPEDMRKRILKETKNESKT